jgi:micrococcal nuclease
VTSRAVRGLIGLAAALLALAGAEPTGLTAPCSHPPRPDALPQARVVRVVDGDTVRARLDGGEERIRLIGLDAPERFPGPRLEHQARQTGVPPEALRRWANAAYTFARRSLAGRAVGLELDVQQRDEFGRLLAYVWTGRVLFNLELVRQGYAWAHPVPPNLRYAERFTACQQDAQAARRGLWGR